MNSQYHTFLYNFVSFFIMQNAKMLSSMSNGYFSFSSPVNHSCQPHSMEKHPSQNSSLTKLDDTPLETKAGERENEWQLLLRSFVQNDGSHEDGTASIFLGFSRRQSVSSPPQQQEETSQQNEEDLQKRNSLSQPETGRYLPASAQFIGAGGKGHHQPLGVSLQFDTEEYDSSEILSTQEVSVSSGTEPEARSEPELPVVTAGHRGSVVIRRSPMLKLEASSGGTQGNQEATILGDTIETAANVSSSFQVSSSAENAPGPIETEANEPQRTDPLSEPGGEVSEKEAHSGKLGSPVPFSKSFMFTQQQ